jgi:hypothetical protein
MTAHDETPPGSYPPPPSPGSYPPPPGTYSPPPGSMPPCYRCGFPAAMHENGLCPGPPRPGLGQDIRSGATLGFAIFATIVAIIVGLVWAGTASSAQACTVTGQLEGQSCYPALQTLHTISGPGAVVLIVVALVLFITGRR